jgi:hypothetical protein
MPAGSLEMPWWKFVYLEQLAEKRLDTLVGGKQKKKPESRFRVAQKRKKSGFRYSRAKSAANRAVKLSFHYRNLSLEREKIMLSYFGSHHSCFYSFDAACP